MPSRTKIKEVTALVLAGGKSTRMGRDKATLDFLGRPLAARAAENASRVFEEVLISGPPSLDALGFAVVTDEHPGAGPLAGIFAGIKAAATPYIITIPCDSPFVPAGFLKGMAELALKTRAEVVVPKAGDRFEPLHAVYACSLASRIERLLQEGDYRIISLYPQAELLEVPPETFKQWDPEGLAFFNINTPEELAQARELAARADRT